MSKQDKKELRQQIACEWLEENYLNYGSLRHDVVTDRLQIRVADLHSLEDGSAYSLSAPHNATSVIGDPAEDGSAYSLRAPHNATSVIGDPAEFRGKDNWRNLTDKDINTMVCQCVAEKGVNISTNEMWTALKSDMVPAVHPLRAWLDGLRPYTADQPDWIDFVAQQVHMKNNNAECGINKDNLNNNSASPTLLSGTGEHIYQQFQQLRINNENNYSQASANVGRAQELSMLSSLQTTPLSLQDSPADRLWRACFKKWFVAMVASWMKDEVVNHTVLVLVGRQGIFKTTWLDNLIPPELRAYSSKLPLSGQISKDDRLRLCENGMLNIDELDAMCGREMNIVKSLLTSTDVNERAAYGRLKERRVRLASFCASTNKREFLTDITGNRRWLPFEVESIQNPFHTIIPYERLYAQAWALAQDPLFSYWFDLDEIEVLEEHNQHFRDESNEEQLLDVYFAVPAEGASNTKFLTTAEISERLIYYGNIKRPLSLSRLGVLLSQKGFLSIRKGSPQRRGWVVYERDNEEINAERRILSKT